MRVKNSVTLAALLAGLLLAPSAQADWMFTPFGGLVFGGDLSTEAREVTGDDKHGVYGASLSYMSDALLGFEVDFGYSPDFFGGDDSLVPDNNLTTAMANLVLSGRMGDTSRIYASGGAGLLKARVDDTDDFFDVDRNDFGANVGAGIVAGLGERVGIRADIRYFRNLGDPEPDDEFDIDFGSFDFWRGTVGLSITF